MTVYYADDQVTLHLGDALTVARELPSGSADCIVTSPPYFGLRDYGTEGQYGLESSPVEYVKTLRRLFSELRRVLADDGTLWLNLGDSYAGAGSPDHHIQGASSDLPCVSSQSAGSDRSGSASSASQNPAPYSASAQLGQNPSYPSPNSEYCSPQSLQETIAMTGSVGPLADMKQGARNGHRRSRPRGYEGIPQKNLIGIPWRVAFALQDDDWILRNDIVWAKPNGMPESVTDRFATKHEHVFLFSKSRSYWFDLDAVRVPHSTATVARLASGPVAIARRTPGESRDANIYGAAAGTNLTATGERHNNGHGGGKNPGDVWTMPTVPFSAAHFAVMPPDLAQRCILAGCKPDGTVLDPFSGSGTTGLAAQRTGRKYVGIDLNADYLDLSLNHPKRLAATTFDFGSAS